MVEAVKALLDFAQLELVRLLDGYPLLFFGLVVYSHERPGCTAFKLCHARMCIEFSYFQLSTHPSTKVITQLRINTSLIQVGTSLAIMKSTMRRTPK